MVCGGAMGPRSKIQAGRKRKQQGRGSDDPIGGSAAESAMSVLLKKLVSLELALSQQRGDFELFGIFWRKESQGKWDLIAAAPWLHSYDRASLQAIVSEVQKSLSSAGLLEFSRVVVLDKGNPFLESPLKRFNTERDPIEDNNLTLLGLSFRRVYIITARECSLGSTGEVDMAAASIIPRLASGPNISWDPGMNCKNSVINVIKLRAWFASCKTTSKWNTQLLPIEL
jgi:hypothetical protein